jgi:3-dehydroquinate dehydratase/shikimate dehydrogenase
MMICVGIARGRHRHVIAEHRFLAENGVKLVELRLDFIQGVVQVKRLLAKRPCPVIVTCRRAVDGGHWARSEEERLLVLRTAIAEGAEYVDLEDDIAARVPRYGRTKRIVSRHDFAGTPPDLDRLQRKLAALDADVVKIATMAAIPQDNLRMLAMIRSADVPTVGLCMGEIGVPTRVLCGRFGAPFTYATFHEDRLLAPGQIAWRQMRDVYRYDSITPATRIYGVIADPVAHSLSPVVHNAALGEAGIDAVYLPFRVPVEALDEFLLEADRWPLSGLSVTIPHKEAVLRHVTHADADVRAIGAANTLVFTPTGIAAHNTDSRAASQSLEATLTMTGHEGLVDVKEVHSALVLGAGGAARAVAHGLKEREIAVTIASRTFDRAQKLAAETGCKAVDWGSRYRMPFDCLVNTTPVGMHPNVDASPYDREHLRPYMVVFDTVYNPENTLLVKEARKAGCRIVTGVDMFVEQAAQQFAIWHGQKAPVDAMRAALKRATASAKTST